MSRYNNIITLLEIAENYNNDKIVELLETDGQILPEALAEDIAFVIISLWGMVPPEKQYEFKNRLTDEIVSVEIEEMFNNDQ